MYSSTMKMFGNGNGNVNRNGNGQTGVCSWLDTHLCCGCLSSDDLSPEPVPDAWCAFIMDFIGLIYERSQWSQSPQDVHALIISRYKTEMIKPPLLRQAPLWSPHLLHWVLQLVPGPVWQSLHFATQLASSPVVGWRSPKECSHWPLSRSPWPPFDSFSVF